MDIVIIGYGVVGQNMARLFTNADLHDPAKNLRAPRKDYDVGFVCVPTDSLPDGSADTSIVRQVVEEWSDRCLALVIKSTVPPGTTYDYNCMGHTNVVFSPEYFGATQHANAVDYDFVILGGDKAVCEIVAEAYREIKPASLRILKTDSTTAELTKYMENAWLATKVTFCNEFARIADTFGVDYTELRELWLQDARVNRSHTFVYKAHPYYSSHCLNKDVPAIVRAAKKAGYTAEFIESVIGANETFKNE
jgi:UDPglucose 6-dehydrogenase